MRCIKKKQESFCNKVVHADTFLDQAKLHLEMEANFMVDALRMKFFSNKKKLKNKIRTLKACMLCMGRTQITRIYE